MPRGLALLAVGVVAATGCRQLFGIDDTTVAADAAAPGADASQQPDAAPLGPWSAPQSIGLGGVGAFDDDPSLTADLLEMYFNSDRVSGNADIFVTRRTSTDAPWGLPVRVDELSSVYVETAPEVSLDGLTIIFASDHGVNDNDIYVAQRGNRFDPWSLPMLMTQLSSAVSDIPGCATADGGTILVSRVTPSGDYDVHLAVSTGGVYTFEPVPGLDGPDDDVGGCMSPALDPIYLESDRATGSIDLFVASRGLLGSYDVAPIDELNSGAADDDVWVSPDGRHLFFHSDRDGAHRIYEATR